MEQIIMPEITVFGFPHSSFVHITQLVLTHKAVKRLRAGQPQVWPPIEHARKWPDSHRPKY
jgi:hypothetical protein